MLFLLRIVRYVRKNRLWCRSKLRPMGGFLSVFGEITRPLQKGYDILLLAGKKNHFDGERE
jgi:hypothetical protein